MSRITSSSAATCKSACDNASTRPAISSNSGVCMVFPVASVAMGASVPEWAISMQAFVQTFPSAEASDA